VAVNFDLFGDPIPEPRDGPGRPEHVWTLENSNKINLLFATGHEIGDAAKALSISQPTLRKHYLKEVEQWRVARLKLKARQLQYLNDEAGKGNVAAIKELLKAMEKGELAQLAARFSDRGREVKKPKPGKKEQQREAARQVGGKYAVPEPPLVQ